MPALAACPAKPGGLVSQDVAAVETRELRRDLADACAQLSTDVQLVSARLLSGGNTAAGYLAAMFSQLGAGATPTVHGRLSNIDASTDALEAKLDQLAANDVVTHALFGTNTAAVNDVRDEVELTGSTQIGSDDKVVETLHANLWFIAGLGASLLASYALYRQVMPRA